MKINPLLGTLKDGLGYLPSQLITRLLGFVTLPLYTRMFLPEEYGTIIVAGTVVTFLIIGVDWVRESAFRFYPAYEIQRRERALFKLVIWSTLVSVVLSLTVIGSILYWLGILSLPLEHLILTIGIFVLESLLRGGLTLLRVRRAVMLFTLFESASQVGRILVGVALVILWRSAAVSIMWAWLAMLILLVPLVLVKLNSLNVDRGRGSTSLTLPDVIQFWKYGLPFSSTILNTVVLTSVDRLMLKVYWTDAEVGVYSVTSSVSGLGFSILFTLFGFASYPIIMKTWENQGKLATERLLSGLLSMYLVFALPMAAGIVALTIPTLVVLTAPEYVPDRILVVLVMLHGFLQGLMPVLTKAFSLVKKSTLVMVVSFIGSAIAISATLVAVPRLGMVGAALGLTLSSLFMVIVSFGLSVRALGFRFELPGKLLFICAVSSFALGVLLEYYVTWSGASVRSILISTFGGAIIYLLTLTVTGQLKHCLSLMVTE